MVSVLLVNILHLSKLRMSSCNHHVWLSVSTDFLALQNIINFLHSIIFAGEFSPNNGLRNQKKKSQFLNLQPLLRVPQPHFGELLKSSGETLIRIHKVKQFSHILSNVLTSLSAMFGRWSQRCFFRCRRVPSYILVDRGCTIAGEIPLTRPGPQRG